MNVIQKTSAAALGLAVLVLVGCSQATSDSIKPATKPAPTTISIDFKSNEAQFTSAESWATNELDTTAGTETIKVNAGSHEFVPADTVDLSKATSFTVDVKGDVKVNTDPTSGNSSWWFSGFRVVLIDKDGKKFDFKDFMDTTDFNNTDFTTVTRGFTKDSGAGWESTGTGDLSKIVKVVIYTNYNVGSLVIKNFSIQ